MIVLHSILHLINQKAANLTVSYSQIYITVHFSFLNRQLNSVNQKTANCFILYSTFYMTLKLVNQLPTNLINQISLNFPVINQKATNYSISYRIIHVTSVSSVSYRLLHLFFIFSLSLFIYPSLNSAYSGLLFLLKITWLNSGWSI